jgi:hypothetical protein
MRVIHVAHILLRRVEDTLDMMIGVIAYRVTTATYLLEELGVASHIICHAEERGLDP